MLNGSNAQESSNLSGRPGWIAGLGLAVLILMLAMSGVANAAYTPATIVNDDTVGNQQIEFDTLGNAVDAHSWDIQKFGSTWYRYGESNGCGYTYKANPTTICGFRVYTSPDLVHWTNHGLLFDPSPASFQTETCSAGSTSFNSGCFGSRVLYNESTGKYVLWFDARPGEVNRYDVYQSESPLGPFGYVREVDASACIFSNPQLFKDTDGSVYLVGSTCDLKLSSDYENLAGPTVKSSAFGLGEDEGPAMFKREGRYFVILGGRGSYPANGVRLDYAYASSPLGPWTTGANPISAHGCQGQPDDVTPIATEEGTVYVFQADRYNGSFQEGLANAYFGALSFNSENLLETVTCTHALELDLTGGSPGRELPRPDLDQSNGSDNFHFGGCDIAGSIRAMQTFTPSTSGLLNTASINVAQEKANKPLIVEIVSVDGSGQVTGTLSTTTVDQSLVGYEERKVTVSPRISVTGGSLYGIVLRSEATSGCYGLARTDAGTYQGGAAEDSTNGGSTYTSYPALGFKFETSLAGPDLAEGAAVTASSSVETGGWGTADVTDGKQRSVSGSPGWSSNNELTNNHSESLTIDLGSSRSVDEVWLWPRSEAGHIGSGFPTSFNIQIGDGTSFTTVRTETNYPKALDGKPQVFTFTPTSGRYVKIEGTSLPSLPDDGNHYRMQLAEAEVFKSPANLAAGSTPFASSTVTTSGFSLGGLADGHIDSTSSSRGWSSNNGLTVNHEESVGVDLGSAETMSEVDLFPRDDLGNLGAGFPKSFVIETSTNGTTYTSQVTESEYPQPIHGTMQRFKFAPTSARYVRVRGTSLRPNPTDANRYRMQLAELEVH